MKVKSYKELIVWQRAMQLVRVVYDATDQFPKYERFALADQLVRAVVSVPSNIAEGFGRSTTKDFTHFLAQARGSLFEVETQLLIAVDRHLSSMDSFSQPIEEVGKLLNGLIASLNTSH